MNNEIKLALLKETLNMIYQRQLAHIFSEGLDQLIYEEIKTKFRRFLKRKLCDMYNSVLFFTYGYLESLYGHLPAMLYEDTEDDIRKILETFYEKFEENLSNEIKQINNCVYSLIEEVFYPILATQDLEKILYHIDKEFPLIHYRRYEKVKIETIGFWIFKIGETKDEILEKVINNIKKSLNSFGKSFIRWIREILELSDDILEKYILPKLRERQDLTLEILEHLQNVKC